VRGRMEEGVSATERVEWEERGGVGWADMEMGEGVGWGLWDLGAI
jgi:hypothetical protein